MEIENTFSDLFGQLKKMGETQKVDESIISTINKLIESCKDSERFWIENESVPIESSFLIYHASRNSRLILEKMEERFRSAIERHENPRVIDDSLSVILLIDELCSIVSSLRKRKITPELENLVSYRLRVLRDVASGVSMLPLPEEEIKELDRKKLKRRFDSFKDTLQAMFFEMQGSP